MASSTARPAESEAKPTSPTSIEPAASFASFVEESRTALLRAFTLRHGAQVAVDLLAESFVTAWREWDRVSVMANRAGWVFRVGERLGVRGAIRERREVPVDMLASTSTMTANTDNAPSSELRVDVAALLDTMPARQRTAVMLVHGDGYTYQEVAQLLDVPVTTIANDVHRGLVELRRLLAKEERES